MADCFSCDSGRVMHVCVLSTFLVLALVFVLSRLWARKIQKLRLELNDYLCVIGLIFTFGLTAFTLHDTISPVLDLSQAYVSWQGKSLLIGELLWVTCVTLIRASVLSLYIRIFRTPLFRTACYAAHGLNLTYFGAVVITGCLICQPISFLWDRSIHGSCENQKSFDLFIGVFNLLMDAATVALPMPVLWGLQVPTKKKIAIAGMFSVGVGICAITIARIKITTDIDGQNTMQQYAKIALLTCLEALLGIINACLPVMKPVFNKVGAVEIFKSLWTKIATVTPNKPTKSPPSNHGNELLRSEEKHPYIVSPGRVKHKESVHLLSLDSPTDVRAPSISRPNFSWRLSKIDLPKPDLEHDSLKLRKDDEAGSTKDWGSGRRMSGEDSPTLPWKPQWLRHHKM